MAKKKRNTFLVRQDAEEFLESLNRSRAKLLKRQGLGWVVIYDPDDDQDYEIDDIVARRKDYDRLATGRSSKIPKESTTQVGVQKPANKKPSQESIIGYAAALDEIKLLKDVVAKFDLQRGSRDREWIAISQNLKKSHLVEIESYKLRIAAADIELKGIEKTVQRNTQAQNTLLLEKTKEYQNKIDGFDNYWREQVLKQQLVLDVELQEKKDALDAHILKETIKISKAHKILNKKEKNILENKDNREALIKEIEYKIALLDAIRDTLTQTYGAVRIEETEKEVIEQSFCWRCDGSGGHNLGCITCDGKGTIKDINKIAVYTAYLNNE
jgi:hypothetical protein